MIRWFFPLVLVLVWLTLNAGVLIDAITYRDLRTMARAILPMDWRAIHAANTPAEAIEAAMTAPQRVALTDAFGQFADTPRGVVLRLPMGLDTEELSLETGCFRYARTGLTFIVWQIDTRFHCL